MFGTILRSASEAERSDRGDRVSAATLENGDSGRPAYDRARAVRSMVRIRWFAIPFALFQVLASTTPYPPGYLEAALGVTGFLALGNVVLWLRARSGDAINAAKLAKWSLCLDVIVVLGYVYVYVFDPSASLWAVIYILPLEGSLLFQRRGAFLVMAVAAVLYVAREFFGHIAFGYEILLDSITFRMGIGFIIAAVAGATTTDLRREKELVEQGQRRLARTNQRLRTVLANLPGMAYRCHNDADWTMEFVSDGVEVLTGYPAASLVTGDVKYNDIIHPEDRERVWEAVQEGLARQGAFQLEYRIIRNDGQERWVWEQGGGVLTDEGEFLEGLIIDASERKQLEETLAHIQKMDAVGQLAGGIAHDFNNILSVVSNYATFIQEAVEEQGQGWPIGRQIREDAGEIGAASGRGAALIRQLLTFSRKEAIQPTRLRLSDVLTEMEILLKRAVKETVELDLDLREDGCINIDRTQLEQILVNLVVNAGDAMPDGGGVSIATRSVDVHATDASEHANVVPGKYVVLSVADTGHGIDDATRVHIFEPFFTTKGRHKGTGLGLATVYAITEAAGGRIVVDSEVGVGTTFRIYLPRIDEAPAEAAVDGPDAAQVDQSSTASVLLVEDERGVRAVAERILQDAGYQVSAAADPLEALGIAERRAFEVIVTDIVMPGMSGWDLVAELRRRHLCPPRVLYVTGYDEALAEQLGRDDVTVLEKPFTRAELLAAVAGLEPTTARTRPSTELDATRWRTNSAH